MRKLCKKLVVLLPLLILSIFILKTYTNNHLIPHSTSTQLDNNEEAIIKVVTDFFTHFKECDYESMKTFCTQSCTAKYFHDKDVWGLISATPTSIGNEIRALSEVEYTIFIDANIEPLDPSLYTSEVNPEVITTSFYLVLQKQDNGSWLIDRFTNG